MVAIGEKSERVLHLTTDALNLNPANYTVWQYRYINLLLNSIKLSLYGPLITFHPTYYRRSVLKELNSDLRKELNFIGYMIEQNPKNYQVW